MATNGITNKTTTDSLFTNAATGTSTAAASTNKATTGDASKSTKKVAGKEEFLTLLINQLQHQDPLDPMKSEEFAVQLAQFSQLEQLMQINEKLGTDAGGAGSVGTMASYLGQYVTVKDAPVQVSSGKGPELSVNIPLGAHAARIDFVNDAGKTVGSQTVTDLKPGKQNIKLDNLEVPDGTYDVRAVAVNDSGRFVDITAQVSGLVEGFVVEPEPALLVNGQEVSMSKVVEVHKPASTPTTAS